MIRTTATIALAALALSGARAEDAPPAPQRVLVVLAHPDDELFMAPAIAALARQGARVTLAYATAGDAGPGVSGRAPGAELGETRMQEARCAGDALGAATVTGFGHGDGTLGVGVHHEGSAAARLKDDLAQVVPGHDLVLTWGPDGGYGHGDHRIVSALATQIVQAMPGEARPRLAYVAIPAGTRPDLPQMASWAETDPALLTIRQAYAPADLAAATAAAACHVTQFDAATRAGMMGLFDATIWRGAVHFRPAF